MRGEPCLCGDPECGRCFPLGACIDLTNYWVEVLDDTGLAWGFAIEAYDEASAEALAMENAKEWGLRPSQIVSITENDDEHS